MPRSTQDDIHQVVLSSRWNFEEEVHLKWDFHLQIVYEQTHVQHGVTLPYVTNDYYMHQVQCIIKVQ